MKRALFLFLILSLPLVAKGKIRCGIEQIPSSFDSRRADTAASQMVVKMLFEGLTRIGLDEKPELALAESYTVSRDGLCYTFVLRKAKWTNGTPILADDFVAAWRSVLDPAFSSPLAADLYILEKGRQVHEGMCRLEEIGVKALDSSTLQVRLEHPVPYFLSLVASPSFFPIPTQSLHKKGKKLISNGPFQLRKKNRLEASPSYWDQGKVALKEIELIPSLGEKATALFAQGKLDCVSSSSFSNFARPSLEVSFLSLNTSLSPLHSSLLRRSLSYAIDRKALVEKGDIPATALVPSSFGLEEKPYFGDGAVERGQMLFDQAREEGEVSLKELGTLSVLYIAGDKAEAIAKRIQHFWSIAFGFEIRLDPVDERSYLDRLEAKQYGIALCTYRAAVSDPIDFLRLFTSKEEPLNYSQWEEQDYTTLFEAAMTTRDQNLRRGLMRACEKLLIEAMPLIPLYNSSVFYLKNPRLSSFYLSPTGQVDFKWAHVENAD